MWMRTASVIHAVSYLRSTLSNVCWWWGEHVLDRQSLQTTNTLNILLGELLD